MKLLNRTMTLTRLFYSRSQLRNTGNLVRCESHREVMETLAQMDILADQLRRKTGQ